TSPMVSVPAAAHSRASVRAARPQPTMFSSPTPALRPRQPEVAAQRGGLVLAPEQAAALQLGYDVVDEILERAGQRRRHQVEAVRAAVADPMLHAVGD